MGLKRFKPTTPGLRHAIISDFVEITKGKPEKSLLKSLKSKGGRNSNGRTTMRFRGGGHKKMYRVIDFKRNRFDVQADVIGIEYDPNRTSHRAFAISRRTEILYHRTDGNQSRRQDPKYPRQRD